MGFFLKALSVFLGSSEDTIVTAKSEMSRALGDERISNNTEKNYILDSIARDLRKSYYYNGSCGNENVIEIIASYLQTWNERQIQILNRVLVYFYGYELGNINTLPRAIDNLVFDLKVYKEL